MKPNWMELAASGREVDIQTALHPAKVAEDRIPGKMWTVIEAAKGWFALAKQPFRLRSSQAQLLMVQYFTLLARREGLSAQAFHDHWRHPHGTLARQIPTMRSYVQSHQLPTGLLGTAQAEFDGVAESTYDAVHDLERTGEEPLFKEYVGPDIFRFIDETRMASLTTDEEVMVSRARTPAGADYSDAPRRRCDVSFAALVD